MNSQEWLLLLQKPGYRWSPLLSNEIVSEKPIGITLEQLSAAEMGLIYALPQEYIAFLQLNNGAVVEFYDLWYLKIWPIHEVHQLAADYGFNSKMTPNLIPFGFDGASNVLAFDTNQNGTHAQYPIVSIAALDDTGQHIAKDFFELLTLRRNFYVGDSVKHGTAMLMTPNNARPSFSHNSVPHTSVVIHSNNRISETLTQLGYTGYALAQGEIILPPVCEIPAGSFLLGSNQDSDPSAPLDEQPQIRFSLAPYQIAQFPVTVAEYAHAVRFGGMREPNAQDVTWHMQLQHLESPVVNITWYDAMNYALWLSDDSPCMNAGASRPKPSTLVHVPRCSGTHSSLCR